MIKLKCKCGCGKIVKTEGNLYTSGHNPNSWHIGAKYPKEAYPNYGSRNKKFPIDTYPNFGTRGLSLEKKQEIVKKGHKTSKRLKKGYWNSKTAYKGLESMKKNNLGVYNKKNQPSKYNKRKHYKSRTGVWGKESQIKAINTNKKNKTGVFNKNVQISGGLAAQKILRTNVRNLKYNGQYYDSKPEIERSVCLQKQYSYIPIEGKTLHLRIGGIECDYILHKLKLIIESHAFWKKNDIESQYYKKRRQILNKNGYKDYSLIVIK